MIEIIAEELTHPADHYIQDALYLTLHECSLQQSFYSRQFVTRQPANYNLLLKPEVYCPANLIGVSALARFAFYIVVRHNGCNTFRCKQITSLQSAGSHYIKRRFQLIQQVATATHAALKQENFNKLFCFLEINSNFIAED